MNRKFNYYSGWDHYLVSNIRIPELRRVSAANAYVFYDERCEMNETREDR